MQFNISILTEILNNEDTISQGSFSCKLFGFNVIRKNLEVNSTCAYRLPALIPKNDKYT